MSEIKGCLICAGEQFSPAFNCTDHLVSHREFRIDRCSSCGFLVTDNAPGPDVISSYYDSPEYISHTGSGKSLADVLYSVARKLMLASKSGYIRRLSGLRVGSILDIGAGTGHFVKKMKSFSWQSLGVEINESARNYALSYNGVELLPSLEDLSHSNNTFDAVTMWHVLEHLHDPAATLRQISSILKPQGSLVIALPNPASADAEHYKEKWAAFDVPRHLWHFQPENITSLVSMFGFTHVGTRRMPFDSFYISILSEKQNNNRFALLKGLTWGKLSWLRSLLNKEKSSSLIYAFRKK